MMKVWDKRDQVWLERDGVDASEMLRLYPERYSKTETKAEPEAVAAVPKVEAVAPAPAKAVAPKKTPLKTRISKALNGAGKTAAPAQ